MIIDRLKRKFNELVDDDSTPKTGQSQVQNQEPSPGRGGHSFAGNLMSKAGNLLKFDYGDLVSKSAASLKNPQSHFEKLDEEILEVLIEENRQLKDLMDKSAHEIEDLKENAEMLKSLEQEASEENEMLKFKVLSLESQAQMEGKDLSKIAIVDEMKMAKKALQKEVSKLQKEVKALQDLQENPEDQEVVPDPKQALDQLRMLYDLHKIDFKESDQTRVMISLLMKDPRLYRLYRERLFQKIAQKAVESAELLYKTSGSSTNSGAPNPVESQSKVYLENKKLKKENDNLRNQIQEQESKYEVQERQAKQQEQRHSQKIMALKQKVNNLGSKFAQLKNDYFQIKTDTVEHQDYLQSFLQPNLNLLNQKIKSYSKQTDTSISQARKAVFDKNKEISDLFMKNKELETKSQDTSQQSKLIYDKNKQIGDLYNQTKQLQEELQEQQEIAQNAQEQLKMLRDKLRQNEGGSNQQVQELMKKNQQLQDEIKEIKHNEVIKSLMKTDVNKDVDEARKAVMDKNKIISAMTNEKFELLRQIEDKDEEIQQLMQSGYQQPKGKSNDSQQVKELQQKVQKLEQQIKEAEHNAVIKSLIKTDVNKEVDEARKAVMDKNKMISSMTNEKFELLRQIEEKDEEIQQLRQSGYQQPKGKSNQSDSSQVKELQQKVQKLEQQIKEAEHNAVIKSLIKTDVNKEVDEARKAVMDKNKIISDMNNKQYEYIRQLEDKDDEIDRLRSQLGLGANPKATQQDQPKEEDDFFGGFIGSTIKSFWGGVTQQEPPKKSQETYRPQEDYSQKQVPSYKKSSLDKIQAHSPPENKQQQIVFRAANSPIQTKTEPPIRSEDIDKIFSIIEDEGQKNDSPSFKKKQQPVKLNFLPDKNEILEQVKDQEEILNTDSPQRILQLQRKQTPTRGTSLRESLRSTEVHEEQMTFKNRSSESLDQQNLFQPAVSKVQKQPYDEEDFFNSFKKHDSNSKDKQSKPVEEPLPIAQPPVSLDFLDNMFGDLLSKSPIQESPGKKVNPNKDQLVHDKVGWADTDDLNIEFDNNKVENEYQPVYEEPTPVPEEEALDIPDIQENQSESPRFSKLQNLDAAPMTGGWQAEEDILIDDNEPFEFKQDSPDKQEEIKLEGGWTEDIELDDELYEAHLIDEQEEKLKESSQKQLLPQVDSEEIQRMFTFSEENKDLLENLDIIGQKAKSQMILTTINEERSGWAADDEILLDDELLQAQSEQRQNTGTMEQENSKHITEIEEVNTDSEKRLEEENKDDQASAGWNDDIDIDDQQLQGEQTLEQIQQNLLRTSEQQPPMAPLDHGSLQRTFTFSEMNTNLVDDIMGIKSRSEAHALLPEIKEEERSSGWHGEELQFDELEMIPSAPILAQSQQQIDEVSRVFTFSELQMQDHMSQFKILAQSKDELGEVAYDQEFSEGKQEKQGEGSGWGAGTLDIIEDEGLLMDEEEKSEEQKEETQEENYQDENDQYPEHTDTLEIDYVSSPNEKQEVQEEEKEPEVPQEQSEEIKISGSGWGADTLEILDDEVPDENNYHNEQADNAQTEEQIDKSPIQEDNLDTPLNQQYQEDPYQNDVEEESKEADDDQQSQPALSEPAREHEQVEKQEHSPNPQFSNEHQNEEQFSPQSQRLPEIQHLQGTQETPFSIMTQHMTETPNQQTPADNLGWDDEGMDLDLDTDNQQQEQLPTVFDERGDQIEVENTEPEHPNQEEEMKFEADENILQETKQTSNKGWSDQMPDLDLDFDQSEALQERGGTIEEINAQAEAREHQEEEKKQTASEQRRSEVLASGWEDDDILDI